MDTYTYQELIYLLNLYLWETEFDNKDHSHNIDRVLNQIITINQHRNDLLVREKIEFDMKVNKLKLQLQQGHKLISNLDKRIEYMKPIVFELFDIRNQKARKLGYKDYVDAILTEEKIDKNQLILILETFIDENIGKVNALIYKYKINWDTWFNDIRKIGKESYNRDIMKDINQFLSKYQMIEALQSIKIYPNQTHSTASIVQKNDIRITIQGDINCYYEWSTLFHELGHALFYLYRDKNVNYTSCIDEVFAVMMESLANYNIINSQEIQDVLLLEYVRTAISALFEFSLWDNLNEAEELYVKYYKKLDINITNKEIWVTDSFRSIDPVYIYSYPLGYIYGQKYINSNIELKELLSNIHSYSELRSIYKI